LEFRKRYRNPLNEQEHIIVTWERGYRKLSLSYRDRLIGTVEDVRELLKGVQFEHGTLRKVEVKLSKDPFILEILVDSYHSPDNLHYPPLKVRSALGYFMPFFAFNSIATIVNLSLYFSGSIVSFENRFFLLFFLIPTLITIVGTTLLRLNKWHGYVINLVSALTQFLVPLFLFFISFYPEFLTLTIIYGIQIGIVLIPLKSVISAYRHIRLRSRSHSETIDY